MATRSRLCGYLLNDTFSVVLKPLFVLSKDERIRGHHYTLVGENFKPGFSSEYSVPRLECAAEYVVAYRSINSFKNAYDKHTYSAMVIRCFSGSRS